jgi:ankyrin repeat protein
VCDCDEYERHPGQRNVNAVDAIACHGRAQRCRHGQKLAGSGRRYRKTRFARALIEAGADVNLADAENVTPLAHALSRKQTEIAGLLKQAGAR